MGDPLSITASIFGITVPALHGMRLLYGDLQKIKDAPDTIKDLRGDILSADRAVTLLQEMEESAWKSLGETVANEAKTVIAACGKACEAFRTDLKRWTSHSGVGRQLSWRDRANVGFFKQGQIESMSKQLQNCKISVNLIISIATL